MPQKKSQNKKSKTQAYVVGVDLGGTKILAAVVDRKGKILSEVKRPTLPASGAKDILDRLAKTVRQAIEQASVKQKQVLAVGVGAPAPVDPQTGFLYQATNIPPLSNFPLGERLSEALGMPAFVDNDVNVGTAGEHALGAGRGTKDMVGIFVGTGVGGGLIVDGRLRHGFRNGAGEVGHMIVGYQRQSDEPLCGCGRPGCLEAYASRTAIERDIRAAIAAGRETLIPELLERSGKGRITSGVLTKALKRGDPLVTEVMERVTAYLTVLIASIVNFFDPEMIVIGGGVAEALGERLLEPIRSDAPRWFIQIKGAERVRIVAAELGDYAGVLGAATIARQKLA
jgi:glucokinase